MKKNIKPIIEILNGGLLITIPNCILKVCNHGTEKIPKCNFSAKAEIGIGIMIIICALVLWNDSKAKSSIIQIGNNIIALLIPLALIGTCGNNFMVCNKLTFPVIYFLCVLMIVIETIYLIKNKGRIDHNET